MFKKITLALCIVAMLSLASSAKAFTGCRKYNFIGTFNRVTPDLDLFGDGTAVHTWIVQVQIHLDGTVRYFGSGAPEFMMNFGTGSDYIGSWTCRPDGKLILTGIEATYAPVNSTMNPNAVVPDLVLTGYARTTYLLSVDSDDQLTKLQARSRYYGANDDPTNPTGGTLSDFFNSHYTLTRLRASDADLNLP